MSAGLIKVAHKLLFKYGSAKSLRNVQLRFESVSAAVLEEFGQPLQVKEIKLRKLKSDELRVCVKYCSVNQSDQQIICGQHEYKPTLPFVPGFEIAGKVIEVGKKAAAAGFKVGDDVIGLNKEENGGFAEMCSLSLNDCYHAPVGISGKVASALLDGYTTACLGLVRRGRLNEGDTVLITAAGGGVGLAAVDLAANVYRAKVIAVCSTEDKAALVREKGAFAALKYNESLEQEVANITKGKGVSLVFDATGGTTLENALKCISHEGRIVLASNAARDTPNLPPSILLPRSISIVGVSLWHYRQRALDIYRKTMEDVIDMAEQELIVPHISKSFDLEEVNEALQYLLDAKCTGKVVLDL